MLCDRAGTLHPILTEPLCIPVAKTPPECCQCVQARCVPYSRNCYAYQWGKYPLNAVCLSRHIASHTHRAVVHTRLMSGWLPAPCSRSLGVGQNTPECCNSLQAHCVPYPQSHCAYQTCVWLVACPSSTMQSSTWTCRLPTPCRELLRMSLHGLSSTMVLLLVSTKRLCCSA